MRNANTVRLTLRLPREVHEALAQAAEAARRSLNAEIVVRLEASLKTPSEPRP